MYWLAPLAYCLIISRDVIPCSATTLRHQTGAAVARDIALIDSTLSDPNFQHVHDNNSDPTATPPREHSPLSPRQQSQSKPPVIQNKCLHTTDTYLLSRCEGDTVHDFETYCIQDSRVFRVQSKKGSCHKNGLCLERSRLNTLTQQVVSDAYCLPMTPEAVSFAVPVKFALDQRNFFSFDAATSPLFGSPGSNKKRYLQAILSTPDGNLSITASRLSIAAQAKQMIYNVEMWATTPGSWRDCVNCGRISLDIVPDGTERIAVNAKMIGTEAGIYLVEVEDWV